MHRDGKGRPAVHCAPNRVIPKVAVLSSCHWVLCSPHSFVAAGTLPLAGPNITTAPFRPPRLAALPRVTVTDIGSQQCGIVSFDVDGMDLAALASQLKAEGFELSTSGPSRSLPPAPLPSNDGSQRMEA